MTMSRRPNPTNNPPPAGHHNNNQPHTVAWGSGFNPGTQNTQPNTANNTLDKYFGNSMSHNNHHLNTTASPQSVHHNQPNQTPVRSNDRNNDRNPNHAPSSRRSLGGVHSSTVKTLTHALTQQSNFNNDDNSVVSCLASQQSHFQPPKKKQKLLRKPLPGPVAFLTDSEILPNLPGSQISISSQNVGQNSNNPIQISADQTSIIPFSGPCWRKACIEIGRPTILPVVNQSESGKCEERSDEH
ncbi:hypothetical protein TL16_g05168 [Triparma laevis f. inornata]|uniref:Uncharacterized protein n=1 Tax=Triparma laevis f. inornata TaxID=1714386 RepID=A0A9W7E5Y6_9STRA|nr:hypothetical protein TL16_g05168 [Triparma laevis f. inornata]